MEEPPWAAVSPWSTLSVEERRNRAVAGAVKENEEYGRSIGISHGSSAYGAVSPEKLSIEVARLEELLRSIEDNGYYRHDGHGGDIGAIVLRKSDGTWCWMVSGGQHRAAVLAGLGYEMVTVRVKQVVHREDVDIWPNVTSGVFSRKAALEMFDAIFDGVPPRVANEWVEQISRQF